MKRIVIAFVISMLCLTAVQAQFISHVGVVPKAYDFWIYVPDASESAANDSGLLPTVVFLHGKSLCGNDLQKVMEYGPLEALTFGRQIPILVIAPQSPGEAWVPAKVMRIVEWVERHYPVDTTRIYVMGMSMGGYGTIDVAATYPEKIAAAMALCGGGTQHDYSGLCRVPLWIMHGTSDRSVPWQQSQQVVDAMIAAGDTSRLRFDLLPDVSHGTPARCFYSSKTYDWLLQHALTDSLRPVNRSISITLSDMRNAYRDMPGRRKIKVKSYTNNKGNP